MTNEAGFSSSGATDLRRPIVAFVLPGGGSLAATQIGMLRALTEARVVPNFVIGASAGALNAVGFAAEPTIQGIDRLEVLWRSLRRHDIAPLSVPDVVRGLRGRRNWLVADTGLRRLLHDNLGIRRFEDLAIPAHVAVTELASGKAQVISHGDAVEALLASAALPGVFPPVRISGRTYIDGGVSANAPVSQAKALGATLCYVLPAAGPSQADAGAHSAFEVALRVLNQVLRSGSVADPTLDGTGRSDHQVEFLPAPASATENFLDFRRSDHLIGESCRLAREWLDHVEPLATAA